MKIKFKTSAIRNTLRGRVPQTNSDKILAYLNKYVEERDKITDWVALVKKLDRKGLATILINAQLEGADKYAEIMEQLEELFGEEGMKLLAGGHIEEAQDFVLRKLRLL